MDHTKAHSREELREHGLQRIRDAIGVLDQKATPEEVEDYRRFVISLANRVAGAKTEKGDESTSDAERAAIAEISQALGAPQST
jgi:hypothetical protein